MDISLQKFNDLPRDLRNKISSPEFLKIIDDLENKHKIKLALLFIKLAMDDLALADFAKSLSAPKFNSDGGVASPGLSPEAISDIMGQFSTLLSMFRRYKTEFFASAQPAPAVKYNTQPLSQPTTASRPANKTNAPKPINLSSTGLAFSPDDEDDIRKFKVDSLATDKINGYEDLAGRIMAKSGYRDQDEVMMNRLQNIIMANLRDVRDDLETIDSLKKNKKIGGLEFSSEQADKLIAIIRGEKNQRNSFVDQPGAAQTAKISFPVKKMIEEKPITSMKSKMAGSPTSQSAQADNFKVEGETLPAKTISQIKPQVSLVDLINQEAGTGNFKMPLPGNNGISKGQSPSIKMEGGLPVVQMPKEATAKFNQPVKITAEIETGPLPPARPLAEPVKSYIPLKSVSAQTTRKPQLDDIKIVKKLVSPVEELGNMTLIDFRRVAADPIERTKKIKEKIGLLEEDSYAKRLEGIAAWQKSEVSKFYRLLGQKSIEDARSVEEVITERLRENKPTLSLDEFHAIMQLNKDLRY